MLGTIVLVISSFNVSQVHFQAALDRARLARERHREAVTERRDGQSGIEPAARETEAAISTVMLTQGAAESYASWVHIQAGIHPGFLKWRKAWERFPAAATALGQPGEFELDPGRAATLTHLGRWRNYLMHTDPDARDRLHQAKPLSSAGSSTPRTTRTRSSPC